MGSNDTQINYDHPCDYQICDAPFEIDPFMVIKESSKSSYTSPPFQIGPGQDFLVPIQIIKTRKVQIASGGKIQFNLRQPMDWYALVIEELEIKYSDEDDYELVFEWFRGNFEELFDDLRGQNGKDAPDRPITKRGLEGFAGETGERGGTRHSPHIFVFVRKISGREEDLNQSSFHFDMNGFMGGEGGRGGRGGKGDEGKRGSDGRQGGIFHACSSGKRGKRGGAPGKGGKGGDGGCGGAGPEIHFYFGDPKLRPILEKSRFDVDGAPAGYPNGDGPGAGGRPGPAGEPGRGGKGGRRAGNCDGGPRGHAGLPKPGSPDHNKWNLGLGRPATRGPDGDYELIPIEQGSLEDAVFNDPNTSAGGKA